MTERHRLDVLTKWQRKIAEDPAVQAVIGPEKIATKTAPLKENGERTADQQREGRRTVRTEPPRAGPETRRQRRLADPHRLRQGRRGRRPAQRRVGQRRRRRPADRRRPRRSDRRRPQSGNRHRRTERRRRQRSPKARKKRRNSAPSSVHDRRSNHCQEPENRSADQGQHSSSANWKPSGEESLKHPGNPTHLRISRLEVAGRSNRAHEAAVEVRKEAGNCRRARSNSCNGNEAASRRHREAQQGSAGAARRPGRTPGRPVPTRRRDHRTPGRLRIAADPSLGRLPRSVSAAGQAPARQRQGHPRRRQPSTKKVEPDQHPVAGALRLAVLRRSRRSTGRRPRNASRPTK